MRHLILEEELHRIDLGDGEWVDIKRYLCVDDAVLAESTPSKTAATLRASIKAWSFMNGNGEPVPVTPETIGRVSIETAQVILVEVNRLNPVRTVIDEKKSSPVSTGPSRRERRSRKT